MEGNLQTSVSLRRIQFKLWLPRSVPAHLLSALFGKQINGTTLHDSWVRSRQQWTKNLRIPFILMDFYAHRRRGIFLWESFVNDFREKIQMNFPSTRYISLTLLPNDSISETNTFLNELWWGSIEEPFFLGTQQHVLHSLRDLLGFKVNFILFCC